MSLVTVLMPVFNGEKFLKQALESILSQSYSELEILVIDDGSTDSSENIVKEFSDSRILFKKNSENLGLIKSLNYGISISSGDFIARMDSDDIAMPHRIERQVQWMKARPNLYACGSFAKKIDEHGIVGGLIRKPVGINATRGVWLPTPIIHPTVMLRSNAVFRWEFSARAKHCEDYELWIRVVRANLEIDNIPEPLLYYRSHQGNVTKLFREEQLKQSFVVFKTYFDVGASFEEFCGLLGANSHLSPARRLKLAGELEKIGCRAWLPELLIFIRSCFR